MFGGIFQSIISKLLKILKYICFLIKMLESGLFWKYYWVLFSPDKIIHYSRHSEIAKSLQIQSTKCKELTDPIVNISSQLPLLPISILWSIVHRTKLPRFCHLQSWNQIYSLLCYLPLPHQAHLTYTSPTICWALTFPSCSQVSKYYLMLSTPILHQHHLYCYHLSKKSEPLNSLPLHQF